jgi:hypothetical protein
MSVKDQQETERIKAVSSALEFVGRLLNPNFEVKEAQWHLDRIGKLLQNIALLKGEKEEK